MAERGGTNTARGNLIFGGLSTGDIGRADMTSSASSSIGAPMIDPRLPRAPFLVRFATRRNASPTPRGETTQTKAIETSDE